VGDVVCCYAELIRIGTTSVTVRVESWVIRRHESNLILVTEGNFTYVAIDDQGRPRRVPKAG
jgi:acyl-CoA thioesterase YciA